MGIKEELTTLEEYTAQIENDYNNIKTALEGLGIEVPEEIKLSEIPDLISGIEIGTQLLIRITADDYEGATFTATHEDTETIATTTISEQSGIIKVPKGGTYTVTNDVDEQNQEAVLVDSVTVSFVKAV